jgi:hypothetical protein
MLHTTVEGCGIDYGEGDTMGFVWREGDWGIHSNKVMSGNFAYCLRHMCKGVDGGCACTLGVCYFCKVKAPDEIVGFFNLVKWKR